MTLSICINIVLTAAIVCLSLGVAASVMLELVSWLCSLWSRHLLWSLGEIFDDQVFRERLMGSSLLNAFRNTTHRIPSYVDPNLLGQAILATLVSDATAPATSVLLESTISQLPPSRFARIAPALLLSANKEPRAFLNDVSQWLDRSLTMLSEAYKVRAQLLCFGLSLIAAVILNINLIALAESTYLELEVQAETDLLKEQSSIPLGMPVIVCSDPTARATPLCERANAVLRTTVERTAPFGWSNVQESRSSNGTQRTVIWVKRVAGWTLTSLVASLFACVFFDLAKQSVGIRLGLRRPQYSPLRGPG